MQDAFMVKGTLSGLRVRRDAEKEAFWRRLIHEQPRSGLSIRAWCAHRHVRESSFFWWRRELVRRKAARPLLTRVCVTSDSSVSDRIDESPDAGSRGSIEILWPDQRRVQVVGPADRQTLIHVFAAMASTNSRTPGSAPC